MPNLKIHLLGFYWSDRDASFASAKRRVCSFHSSHLPASCTSSSGCKYAILRGRVKKRHFYAPLSTLNAWYNAVMASPALFTIKAIKNTCPSTIQTCSNTGFPPSGSHMAMRGPALEQHHWFWPPLHVKFQTQTPLITGQFWHLGVFAHSSNIITIYISNPVPLPGPWWKPSMRARPAAE